MSKTITANSNTMLSKLNRKDLLDFLDALSNYYINYRSTLNLPSDLYFGMEIEFEELCRSEVTDYISNEITNPVDMFFHGWTTTHDQSLSNGGEVISPVSTADNETFWINLKKICTFLKRNKAIVDKDASCHMHFSTAYLGNDVNAWKLLIDSYTAYEPVLFRFFYGDMLCPRYRILTFAEPIGDFIISNLDKINQASSVINLSKTLDTDSKFKAINLSNVDFNYLSTNLYRNTFEFRMPNGSTNHVVLQNNLNLAGNLIYSAKNKLIDEEFIDYKLKHEYVPFEENKYRYNEVLLKDALEFADINFDNDLDKANFLKQYFKDFENSCSPYNQVKPKVFTK